LFDSRAYITDNYNMSMTIYVEDTVSQDEVTIARALNIVPRPQGVRLYWVKYSKNGTFGFGNNPNAKTFGQGKFASLI
jgi:hypothetical protein